MTAFGSSPGRVNSLLRVTVVWAETMTDVRATFSTLSPHRTPPPPPPPLRETSDQIAVASAPVVQCCDHVHTGRGRLFQ